MPFRFISSRSGGSPLWRACALAGLLLLVAPPPASAFTILPDPATDVVIDAGITPAECDLYLAVSINGQPRNLVATVHQEADGSLSIAPEDLKSLGLTPPVLAGAAGDARIPLSQIPDVTYSYDPAQQTIDFDAPDSARARLIVPASGRTRDAAAPDTPRSADFGALLNYDIYASASRDDGQGVVVDPLSGAFEARAFGPFGLVDQTFSVLGATHQFHRLDSTWSYSDPQAMRTLRAGDIVTGALSWTRPTRLGGVQVQNDFGLRSDIITYPVPSISGSAALPSSVDVYVNNADRFTGSVPAGPFDIVDVPVITGAGTVKLVVRDATGKEVVTSADYFASQDLLRPGLWDYSVEAGFARTHFGSAGDGYDSRLMGSASIRTGVSDWLTWEGHAEGGAELLNAGTGLVGALGRLGVGQFAVAASRTAEASGVQLSGSLQLSFGPVALGVHAQRSFGRYEDIASFTAPGISDHTAAAPAALYQASVSAPVPFARGRAALSYTQSEPASGDAARILSVSYGQQLFAGSASASAYKDFQSGNYGVMASLWMPLGSGLAGGTSIRHDSRGTALTADIGHAASDQAGDFGWLLRMNRDESSDFSASGRTRLPVASVRGQLTHYGSQTAVGVEVAGAVVAAGGGVFLSNPVDDAFAVVDVGAAGVPVLYQNRVVGVTGKNGKLLVPGLAAYEKNRISIDPGKLPLDAIVEDTATDVAPARGSGVVVTFGKRVGGGTALVSFRDAAGNYLPLASTGRTSPDAPDFIVGYDGAALLEGLMADNIVTITTPDGGSCVADVPFTARGGDLVTIADVVCRPQ